MQEKGSEEEMKEDISWTKDIDRKNKYWIKIFKIMPRELQEQIMYASPFVSTGVMIWITSGRNTKEIKRRSSIIDYYEKLYKEKSK